MWLFVIPVFVVVVIIFVWARLSTKRYAEQVTPSEICDILTRFLDGTGSPYEWDDFISINLSDPKLEAIRQRCEGLREEFPPHVSNQFCGPQGLEIVRGFVLELRSTEAGRKLRNEPPAESKSAQ
jgi:hypothetical protein